jgi:hypothetical protein
MNVQEVLQFSKERDSRSKRIVKLIIEKINKKIVYYAKTLKKESCSYQIPPIIEDIPVYNLEKVIQNVFKNLDSEGFIVQAYSNGQVDICWTESLVKQKVKTDAYYLDESAKKLKNITLKSKKIDERFNFLANPNKITQEKNRSIEEQVDSQIEKILKEKESLQKRYKKML